MLMLVGTRREVRETLRRFARAEADLSELEQFGVIIDPVVPSLTEPKLPVVRVELDDVALGLVGMQSKGDDLRIWAFVVLGLSSIDLSRLEVSTEGEVLLDCLWNASANLPLNGEQLAVLRSVAAKSAT